MSIRFSILEKEETEERQSQIKKRRRDKVNKFVYNS